MLWFKPKPGPGTPESKWQIKPFMVISLDGWGIAPDSKGNAISLARTPSMDYYWNHYPHTQLIASGESVGLPANEVGNSEVGHLTMGVGRVIFQSLERINMSIRDETFFTNQAFLAAIDHARQHNSQLHLIGMVGSGNVHSSTKHLVALLDLCQRQQFTNVVLHLFSDGRDSPPQEGVVVMQSINTDLKQRGFGRIATVSGRYYGMDRDARWERVKLAYEAMTLGRGPQYQAPEQAVSAIYTQGKSDEFVLPSVILPDGGQSGTINDNDAAIFFNFRVDRARELTMAFVLPDFEHLAGGAYGFSPAGANGGGVATFLREKKPNNLFFATMTEYQEGLPVAAIAFAPERQLRNGLAELVTLRGWRQFHAAESEKERMVAYYFNGMRSERFAGEDVSIVPSPKVATYDLIPQMNAAGIVDETVKALRQDVYTFFMLNFANPDMVAHTGNLDATVKGIEACDAALGKLVTEVLKHDGVAVITADHGNAEELITFPTDSFFFTSSKGTVNTDHSSNPIPLIFVGNRWQGKNVEMPKGVMSDIAPTLLRLMGIPKPGEMIGRDLGEGILI
jgi:2,3-bisphosphoglycerate-independent phosphoglycerate mutase